MMELFISLVALSIYGSDDISGTLDNKIWIKPLGASFSLITNYVTTLTAFVYKHVTTKIFPSKPAFKYSSVTMKH